MIETVEASPLLLLFLVMAIGYWIGRIRIRGSSVGVGYTVMVPLAIIINVILAQVLLIILENMGS